MSLELQRAVVANSPRGALGVKSAMSTRQDGQPTQAAMVQQQSGPGARRIPQSPPPRRPVPQSPPRDTLKAKEAALARKLGLPEGKSSPTALLAAARQRARRAVGDDFPSGASRRVGLQPEPKPEPVPEPEPEPEPEPTSVQRLPERHVPTAAGQTVDMRELPAADRVLASMLVHLASNGQLKDLQSLLDADARLDVASPAESGVTETVLHILARSGRAEAVQLVLEYRADVSVLDSNGETAMDVAAAGGHVSAVAALLDRTPAEDEPTISGRSGELALEIPGHVGSWTEGVCSVALSPNRATDAVTLTWEPAVDAAAEASDQLCPPAERTSAGIIDVSPCRVLRAALEVKTSDGRLLRLSGTTEPERNAWVASITMALARTDSNAADPAATGSDTQSDSDRAPPAAKRAAHANGPKQRRGRFACCSAPQTDDGEELSFTGFRSQAKPSERITELLSRADNGADPNVRGRGNMLPVVCLPGFCSSSLMVTKSDVMPSWIGSRVWFSLQKLSRARTQHSGTATHGAATSLSVRVHKAMDLTLDEETDRDSIDGLVVRLRLQTEDGAVLAETQTKPIRLVEGQTWSGVAEYDQEVRLESESTHSADALVVSLIDSDTAEFEDAQDETANHFGTVTIGLKKMVTGRPVEYNLSTEELRGSAGVATITCGALVCKPRRSRSA
eukprot:COSAG06_NODE_2687_length_6448_cov_4.882659_2_plen_678_part_00